jgi:hypothetical protein
MNFKRTSQTTTALAVAIIGITIVSAALLLSLEYSTAAIAQKQNTNQSQMNKTKNTNAAPIGNTQQLSKALGNNSKVIANNTNIGNPNAGKAASTQEKVTSGTDVNGLSSNPTKGPIKGAAGGASQNKTTTGSSNMTNATAGKANTSGVTNSTTPKK